MCWESRKQDIKIAEQDIPIFKVMKKTPFPEVVKSIYQDFIYVLNSLTESNIKIEEVLRGHEILIEVDKALHSYNPEKIKCLMDYSMINIYGSLKLDWFVNKDKDIIEVKGIIPKGSKYMENKKGEYVSNQLILKEVKSLV